MERKYVLELTAEELKSYLHGTERTGREAVYSGLKKLYEQAVADREADELRLPWSAVECNTKGKWLVLDCEAMQGRVSERAAKIRAAGHDLLEAVQAVKSFMTGCGGSEKWERTITPLIQRALKKVETGVPE